MFRTVPLSIITSFSLYTHSFISIQPLGRFGRNQSSVRWPVWLWHATSWAHFLGVGCHYFPPLLDVPTFAARCLHVRNDARDPNSQRWNCGREGWPVILRKWRLPRHFRDLLHAENLRHGTDDFTSPPKEDVLRIFFIYVIRVCRQFASRIRMEHQ
jgi:hypothetical protein